jgi:hypothetical protein
MSEPFVERLSRFTPDAGGLDRDALLFAAGRGSARPNRAWVTLAAGLAVTQVVSLVLLWPRPGTPAALTQGANAPRSESSESGRPAPDPPVEPPSSDPPESPALWTVRHSLLESEPDDRSEPADSGTLIDSGPPLRAFAAPPRSILN